MLSNLKKPFIKRFKTERGLYVYDVNTNDILKVDQIVYDILGEYGELSPEEICKKYGRTYGESVTMGALNEIKQVVKKKVYFCQIDLKRFVLQFLLKNWR